MTPQELAQLFSIFHDGVLALVSADDDLALTVEIPYLARRVDPAFTRFAVRLESVADLRFVGWATPDARTAPEEIFGQALEIYRAEVEGDTVAERYTSRRSAPWCGTRTDAPARLPSWRKSAQTTGTTSER